jgi:GrpB-like predicted nucleotidyltransferase (UPF0157 family)
MPQMGADEQGREFRDGVLLGPMRGTEGVKIVEYDARWPELFEQMRERLAAALGGTALRIDHVGSTAIPGLAAKPIVDIQVSVPDVDDEPVYRLPIEAQGFVLRYREPGHRYFRPPPGLPRLYQVHVCTIGSKWERDHLLFRDYLRGHPAAADEYAAVKRRAAAQHPIDRVAYTDAKDPWIRATVATAEEWARATAWQP